MGAFDAEVHHIRLRYVGATPSGKRSDKFYEAYWGISELGSFAVFRWGKTGSQGQAQLKLGALGSNRAVDSKLEEKRDKGYRDSALGKRVAVIPDGVLNAALRKEDFDTIVDYVGDALLAGGRHPDLSDYDLDDYEEMLKGPNPASNGDGSLSERALALISKAAVSPSEVFAEYAVLQGQLDEEKQKINEADRAIRTLEIMLGLDDEG